MKVDTRPLEALAADLDKIDPEKLNERIIDTINEVAADAYELSRKTILSGINLSDPYVKARMDLRPATKQTPKAEIVAPGGKGYQTGLSHYGAMVQSQPVRWTNEKITSLGHKFGMWPGWTRRTGTPHMGIPVGQKPHTMSAQVVRGSTKSIGKKFTLKGKKDSEGNPLVFRNIGPGGKDDKGKLEVVLGPAVYQLFRKAIPLIEEGVADDLQAAVAREAERMLEEALAK